QGARCREEIPPHILPTFEGGAVLFLYSTHADEAKMPSYYRLVISTHPRRSNSLSSLSEIRRAPTMALSKQELLSHNKEDNSFIPRVSIGMPVFNGELYLEKALQS